MNTIFVVHSEEGFARNLGNELEKRGFRVHVAADITAAILLARKDSPQFVLVEPRLLTAGTASVKEQIETASGHTAAVLVLTYWATDELNAEYERHGAGLLTAPPEDVDSLARQLGWLRSRRDEDGPRPPSTLSEEWLFSEATAKTAPVKSTPARSSAGIPIAHALLSARMRLDAGEPGASISEQDEGPRVLVVDDDPHFRSILAELLINAGYRVYASINAPNALLFLKKNPIDLVIADIHMPHVDGFELKHELDCFSTTLIPFVIMTAQPTAENRALAERVGAAAFVAKPIVDMPAFLQSLRSALARTDQPPSP